MRIFIDTDGNPVIQFQYVETSESLEDAVIGAFVNQAIQHGIVLRYKSGMLISGQNRYSKSNYEIRIAKQNDSRPPHGDNKTE